MPNSLVCYTIGLNYVTSSNQYYPCGPSNSTGSGGAQSCCFAGDYCMEDSICHYTHGGVTNGTGYYMAGCTDPSWQDPACPKACTSEYGADVIYDTTNREWDCCQSAAGVLDCQNPSNFTVQAPGPNNLAIVKQLNTVIPSVLTTAIGPMSSVKSEITSSSTVASSSATTTSSSSRTMSMSSSSAASSNTGTSRTGAAASATASPTQNSSSGGLSGGAKAGIAVGVVVGALLIIAAIFFFWRRNRNKQKKAAVHEIPDSPNGYGAAAHYAPGGMIRHQGSELESPSSRDKPSEMTSGPHLAHELDGDQRQTAELEAGKNKS